MRKNLTTKIAVIAVTILVCIFGIIGLPKSKDELLRNIGQNLRLGLDLKGGSHLILQVQVQDAAKAEADGTIERLKEELRKAAIDYAAMDRNDPATVEEADRIQINVTGIPAAKTSQFRSLIADRISSWVLSPVNSTDYRLNLRPSEMLALKQNTVKTSIETIDNRINGLGLTEPVVRQHGGADAEYEIEVQLPGVDDPARVKAIMQTAAVLELIEVKGGPYPSQENALSSFGGVLPFNTKLVKSVPGGSGDSWFLLARTPVVTGRDLRGARPGQDEFRKWQVGFTLTQEAAGRFGRYTEPNIGNRMAIVLDNQVKLAPTIQAKLTDEARITGLSGEQEASDLALVLRAGALPAGLTPRAESSVGPSLGADSIHQGIVSGLTGLAAVVLVMLIYYRKSGVNAVLALVLNTIILVAALSYFSATLTLPGIAGIILTIGMAVDSNVLIFERIREELRAPGKSIVAAVDAGFSKAWWTIVDTHVTTIVSCAFLFLFGSGPVKGFAVTLVIGLVANVFTAVFVSKVIFDFELSGKRQPQTLSI